MSKASQDTVSLIFQKCQQLNSERVEFGMSRGGKPEMILRFVNIVKPCPGLELKPWAICHAIRSPDSILGR